MMLACIAIKFELITIDKEIALSRRAFVLKGMKVMLAEIVKVVGENSEVI